MSAPDVTVYGVGLDGTQKASVDLENVRVLIEPKHATHNDEARAVAGRIADGEREASLQRGRIADLEAQVKLLQAAVREARAINEAMIFGRRRFFGPVLMRPVSGDWKGEVWLLDPTKQERGRGLRFANVAEVHTLHPELWVVGTSDGGVLLDAFALHTPRAPMPAPASRGRPREVAICSARAAPSSRRRSPPATPASRRRRTSWARPSPRARVRRSTRLRRGPGQPPSRRR